MREQIKTAIILVIGWSFIILGIFGLFLPILQGILFLLVGLYILAKRSRWARKLVQRLSRRYPRLTVQLREAQQKGEDLLKKGKELCTRNKR